MTELGNELVNGILEAKVDAMSTKKSCIRSQRWLCRESTLNVVEW